MTDTQKRRRVMFAQLNERMDAMIEGQPWVAEHLAMPATKWSREGLEWMHSRPRVIQELLVRFPPMCLVRSKPGLSLLIPGPGTVGIVLAYSEDGNVAVIQGPESPMRGWCPADEMELAGCVKGLDPDDIRAALGWPKALS